MDSWEDFKKFCQDKKLILYGLGTLLNYFFIRCGNEIPIAAAIDNDVTKQGQLLKDFFDESDLNEAKDIKISPKDLLHKYEPSDTVILISSFRYFEEIANELAAMGFKNTFSAQILESNYRKKNNLSFESQDNYMSEYAKFCAEKYPIDNNKIIFLLMDRYPEHGKYITEKLLSLNKNLDIVWTANSKLSWIPNGVRFVNEGKWKQFIYEIETAKILMHCTAIRTTYQLKRSGQIYFQIKHWGSLTLKKFFLDETENNETDLWRKTGELYDYIISGSDLDEQSCRSGFNFHGEFVRFGSPRSDILFTPDKYKEKIHKIFGLNVEDRILLYAPTWRGHSTKYQRGANLDFELLKNSLTEKFGGSWKFFLKFHPTVKSYTEKVDYPDCVINVSNYPDGQELIAASDIMITDYSSIMFEPAYVLKPVFLCAPDKYEYIKSERTFLIDYDSLPFPISMTNEELSAQIKNFDDVAYKARVQRFLEKYGVHEDGKASERTAKFIIELSR